MEGLVSYGKKDWGSARFSENVRPTSYQHHYHTPPPWSPVFLETMTDAEGFYQESSEDRPLLSQQGFSSKCLKFTFLIPRLIDDVTGIYAANLNS